MRVGELLQPQRRDTCADPTIAALSIDDRPEVPERDGQFSFRALANTNEAARWLLLLTVGILVTRPLLLGRWLGGPDQAWYLQTFQDFLLQARSGVFPPIVGQTEFSYNGFPIVRTVLFYYEGALLDVLTLHTQAAVALLYTTLALSIIGGFFSMYVAMRSLHPRHPWLAAGAGVVYGASPAVLAATYVLDMVPTVSAVPFVPLLVYGIVRFIRRPGMTAHIALAVALTLLLVSHAIVALWAVLLTALVLLPAFLLRHRNWRTVVGATAAAAGLVALSAFFTVPLFALNFGDASTIVWASDAEPRTFFSQAAFERLQPFLQGWFADQFLPIPVSPNESSTRLGYGLWIFVLLGVAYVIRRRSAFELILLAIGALMAAFVLPVPVLSNALYRALPVSFEGTLVPHQRLFLLFGGLATAVAMRACSLWREKSWREKSPGVANWLVPAAVGIACACTLFEAQRFLDLAQLKLAPADYTQVLEAPIGGPPLHVWNVAMADDYTPPPGFSGSSEVYDPVLDNALVGVDEAAARVRAISIRTGRSLGWPLLDGEQAPSNLQAALTQADGQPSLPLRNLAAPGAAESPALSLEQREAVPTRPIVGLRVQPGLTYLLTYRAYLDNAAGLVTVIGPSVLRQSLLSPCSGIGGLSPETSQGLWTGLCSESHAPVAALQYLSLWTTGDAPLDLELSAELHCFDASVGSCNGRLDQFHLQTYATSTLPIHVSSLFPYRAQIGAAEGKYLETHRMFVAGYSAHVNGVAVEPVESRRGRVMVPLTGSQNTVELDYVGTPAMLAARWLSLLGWLGLGLVVLMRRSRATRWAGMQLRGLVAALPMPLRTFAGWTLIGVLAVAGEIALLALVHERLGVPVWLASALAAETMMLVRFATTDRLVFGYRYPSLVRLARYHAACGVAFAVSWGTLNVLAGIGGVPYGVAWVIGTLAALGTSAASNFVWVWGGSRRVRVASAPDRAASYQSAYRSDAAP